MLDSPAGRADWAGSLEPIVSAFAPRELLCNKDFIRTACHLDSLNILASTDPMVLADVDFLADIGRSNPDLIWHLPREKQLLLPPEFIISFVEMHPNLRDSYCFAKSIAVEFWNDRDFALRWFKSGQLFHEDIFPVAWKKDKDAFLLIAKYRTNAQSRHESFMKASLTLRGDTKFMAQALEHDPTLFDCATAVLREDVDLAVLAFRDPKFCEKQFGGPGYNESAELLGRLIVLMRERLELLDLFLATFLRGMVSSSHVAANCGSTLSILDQGMETSVVHKKLIAKYLNVPTGRELLRLRQAYQNLCDVREYWGGIAE